MCVRNRRMILSEHLVRVPFDGIPDKSEIDGWHWLKHRDSAHPNPLPYHWFGGKWVNSIIERDITQYIYYGPCPYPEA